MQNKGMKLAEISLPYDRTCPVVYDNDSTGMYIRTSILIALASAGDIDLRGIITSYPYDKQDFLDFCVGREEIVAKARRSGMSNLPDHVQGPGYGQRLNKPNSGHIEDTVPIDTAGSRLIIEQAKLASREKPLVIVMGGPLTVAADAYLLDPSIADRVVVAAVNGTHGTMGAWNGELDPWACYIVLERLRYVQFITYEAAPIVPKCRLMELPECEFRQWMIEKEHPTNFHPGERDYDGAPAISLMRPEYCLTGKYVAFSHFDGQGIPCFQDADLSTAILIEAVDDEGVGRALHRPVVRRALARRGDPAAEALLSAVWDRARVQGLLVGMAYAGVAYVEWAWLAGRFDIAQRVGAELLPRLQGFTHDELARYLARCDVVLGPVPGPRTIRTNTPSRSSTAAAGRLTDACARSMRSAPSRRRPRARPPARAWLLPRVPKPETRANPAGLTQPSSTCSSSSPTGSPTPRSPRG